MSQENTLNNILVAIDPSESEQYALQRAFMMNNIVEGGIKIHLFIAMDLEKLHKIHDAHDYYCDDKWLAGIYKLLDDENIDYTVEIIWTESWHFSILDAAKRHSSHMIILSDYRSNKKRTELSSSKWSLLRDSKCPVLIVDPSSNLRRKTVLAAVNMQTSNPKYAELNKNITRISSMIASSYGAEKHIVNAYESSDQFPDRAKIIREADVKQENIHVKSGNPVDNVTEVADEIDADVVIIGTLARKGVMAAMRGNKSEEIIHKLNRDVMVINSATV